MVTGDNLLERAVLNFPRDTDIRKRKTSNGARLLKAIVDEADDFNKAIEKLRQSFFAVYYKKHADDIIFQIKRALIGSIEEFDALALIDNSITLTRDENEFIKDKESVYYSDGYLYLHEADEYIDYTINGNKYSAKTNSYYVWNIIDEFALYAGIERMEQESNESLLSRCFLSFSNSPSSTKQGLKNAIQNVVSNTEVLHNDDISIEPITKDNVYEEVEDGSLIEILSAINADVYREKRWNLNRWEHPFKKLLYAPHQWDIAISTKQNGVGGNDDLKVVSAEEVDDRNSTNIQIGFYKESEASIFDYIRNNDFHADIPLTFSKVSNVLKSKRIDYKILAEEIPTISKDNVIALYKNATGSIQYKLEDIVANTLDVEGMIVEGGKLEDGKQYKLLFEPTSAYSEMAIYNCSLNGSDEENLLKPQKSFEYVNGVFKNKFVKAHIDKIKRLYNKQNLMDTIDGIQILDSSEAAHGEIDVRNMENQYVQYKVTCPMTKITSNGAIVKYDKFSLVDDHTLHSEKENAFISFKVKAKELKFLFAEGNANIDITIDGETTSEVAYKNKQYEFNLSEPKQIEVQIKTVNTLPCTVKNIEYNSYIFNMNLASGEFYSTFSGLVLPDQKSNFIYFDMQTFTGYSPVLEYIHVGNSMKNSKYETEVFLGDSAKRLLVDSTCNVTLIEMQGDEEVNRIENYRTNNLYTNTSSMSKYIQVNIPEYNKVDTTSIQFTHLSKNGLSAPFICIQPNETIEFFTISGSYSQLVARYSVSEILKTNDTLYSSKILSGFIRKNDSDILRIFKSDLGVNFDLIKIETVQENVTGTFVTDISKNINFVGKEYNDDFEYFYLSSASNEQYIAYNRVNVIKNKSTGISIVDLFTPRIPENKNMVYRLFGQDDVEIVFENTQADWSIDLNTVSINLRDSILDSDNYETEEITLSKNFLLSPTMYLTNPMDIENKSIDLSEYMLKTDDYLSIMYKDDNDEIDSFYIENDGFNKLKKSNVYKITKVVLSNGDTVPSDQYTLLKDEGIIIWNNATAGIFVEVFYNYKVPKAISIQDVSKMYDIIGYKVDALELLRTVSLKDVTETMLLPNDVYSSSMEATYVDVKSSNPNYYASVQNDKLIVEKISDEDDLLIKNGYFYHSGNEYYQFANRHELIDEKNDDIEYLNTSRIGNRINFTQSSKNYLPDSNMYLSSVERISEFDFEKSYNVNEASKIGVLSSCDQMHNWRLFDMNISLTEGLNGLGLLFNPYSEYSYAYLDITSGLSEDSIITLYANTKEDIQVMEERLVYDMPLDESLVVSNKWTMEQKNKIYTLDMKGKYKENVRYYLYVKGMALLDDIIITDNREANLISIHKKNDEMFGIFIPSPLAKDEKITLPIDPLDARSLNIELDSDGMLTTSNSISWGYTLIKSFSDASLSELSLESFDEVKDCYVYTENRNSKLTTAPVPISNTKSVRSVIINIHELTDRIKNYSVSAYTCKTANGTYKPISSTLNDGVVEINGKYVQGYVKLSIYTKNKCAIDKIDVYAQYVESNEQLGSHKKSSGELLTKVYDIGEPTKFRVSNIDIESTSEDDYSIQVRCVRQDYEDEVYTDWYDYSESKENHVFDGYEFIQFRISFYSALTRIGVHNFTIEVME